MLGRPVRITDGSPSLDRLPAGMATDLAWAHAGGAAYVTDHVPRVLNRPAATFVQWAHDHREDFAAMS